MYNTCFQWQPIHTSLLNAFAFKFLHVITYCTRLIVSSTIHKYPTLAQTAFSLCQPASRPRARDSPHHSIILSLLPLQTKTTTLQANNTNLHQTLNYQPESHESFPEGTRKRQSRQCGHHRPSGMTHVYVSTDHHSRRKPLPWDGIYHADSQTGTTSITEERRAKYWEEDETTAMHRDHHQHRGTPRWSYDAS